MAEPITTGRSERPPGARPISHPREDPPDLSPEEEAALDRVCDRIGAEDARRERARDSPPR